MCYTVQMSSQIARKESLTIRAGCTQIHEQVYLNMLYGTNVLATSKKKESLKIRASCTNKTSSQCARKVKYDDAI